MSYFELTNNSSYERDWAVAVSITPTSHLVKWHCLQCGRSDAYPAGSFDVVLEDGSKFPDFLSCGAYPLLIVSHRVISALEDAGVHTFHQFPVGVAAIQESGLRKESAPRYFRIEVTGGFMVDLLASGVTITGVCGRCGELDRKPLSIRPLGAVTLVPRNSRGISRFGGREAVYLSNDAV
jgi:hypothetical protein